MVEAADAFPGLPRGEGGLGQTRPSLARRQQQSNRPVTQVDVEVEILRFVDMLEQETDAFAGRARDAAEAEANYKGKWASEYLKADGTEKKRAAVADVKCHDLYFKRKLAEGLKEATKESCSSMRAQLDALRTLSANIRNQT